MFDEYLYSIVQRLPRVALTRALQSMFQHPVAPALRPLCYGAFARAVGVEVREQQGAYKDYDCLSDYFARPLRSGVRTWPESRFELPAASDGQLYGCGDIEGGRLPSIKGQSYTTSDFLKGTLEASRFDGGSHYTIYLSPRDYHRVHSPVSGTLRRIIQITGDLWPVRPGIVARRPGIFAENERVLFEIITDAGETFVIAMVGAMVVGSVQQSIDEHLPCEISQGDELGAFHLGSTVVVLTTARLSPASDSGELPGDIRLGASVGRVESPIRAEELSVT